MERLVETVMRHERQTDLLDRVVLAVGVLSLALALAGTFMTPSPEVAADTVAAVLSAV